MKRRDFLRTSVGSGIAAGAAIKMGGFEKTFASSLCV